MDFKEQPTLSWKMHLQLILLMHVHTGIPLKHTKGLYCLSPQVLGMELRSPLNSSPKTHLGAASCYRLRPRSDAVSESAALLRSSHRLSSPRRNPLFERDVRSNRRSNSLYLAATLGGCGAFVVKDFLTPLFKHCWMIIDHMAIPTILQTAQIKTGNDWKQSVD